MYRRNRKFKKELENELKYDTSLKFDNLKLNIITTTNEIDTYYSFLPSSYQSWKKIFPNCTYVLGLITNKDEESNFVKRAKKFCDKIFIYKELEGVETGIQAKTTRMYLTTKFDEELCLITDIDFYLLNKEWFLNKIKPAIEENKFVTIGNNGYLNTSETGKWPMYYNISTSNNFKKLLNYQNLDNYKDWFNQYNNIKNPIDNKECVKNKFDNFSDESLIRYIIAKHPDKKFINNVWIKQDLEGFYKLKSRRRVDRGWWKESCNIEKIIQGHYVDCFPLRPFHKNFDQLKPILEYLKLDLFHDNIFFVK